MVNQRRQSMQLSAASPLPIARAPSSRLASGMLDTFSSINTDENGDMNMTLEPELAEDEEFAAEEHAHRFALAAFAADRQLGCLPGSGKDRAQPKALSC